MLLHPHLIVHPLKTQPTIHTKSLPTLRLRHPRSLVHSSYYPTSRPDVILRTPPTCMAHTSIVATAISAATTSSARFPQFLFGFLLGGLLFSTAVALAGAFFVLGGENFKRVLSVRKLVFGRVWKIFLGGLNAARVALRADDSWNWREAWMVLRNKFRETRRAASEALEALRLEAGLYAAAVGKPGLVALQYSVDHLTPKLFSAMLEDSLRQSLSAVKANNVKKVELTDFSVGKKTPELLGARAYELGGDAMAFDIDVRWDSELQAKLMVTTTLFTVPISLRNFRFVGIVRVVLSPLTPELPGFGAALLSLPAAPTVGIDVRMAGGEITRMPWLKKEIMSTIQKAIEDEYLWPRRVVIPSAAQSNLPLEPMLSPNILEALKVEDPLLRAERKLAEKPVYRKNLEKMLDVSNKDSLQMKILVEEEGENCDDVEGCTIEDWRFPEEIKIEVNGTSNDVVHQVKQVWGNAFEFANKAYKENVEEGLSQVTGVRDKVKNAWGNAFEFANKAYKENVEEEPRGKRKWGLSQGTGVRNNVHLQLKRIRIPKLTALRDAGSSEKEEVSPSEGIGSKDEPFFPLKRVSGSEPPATA
mmetsp:Transcript_25157/g.36995  ORF Transcript_25157/g.36995 Transcript_25157/m.36995 type:complete len:588 (-) Transcript_25157:14-1777(-)|eukprot:CAMPEP_0195526422 /NCGR_PEP_ID=MMETSP0794_2-20130614/27474_1 /TAXON_ID=515487 /ORGANISM="Stephanopyxis turris, Strain CCMP 815" /LENGTH=587 /DNA_ID=CAMNT_0040657101 /DNA_START=33 /DNA_END=1796 /DNA_ORIENTATION=-